ncbi:hypothetical protein ANAPRD1_00098 [Anaplasma phagocytophilum]|nr:hypothetical protein ANAPRD1_00098 [Anaplasma phagocytophilum]
MMLLLDRLISLPLLLPKLLVKTSCSLLRRWRFLIPRSMTRFVGRSGRITAATTTLLSIRILLLLTSPWLMSVGNLGLGSLFTTSSINFLRTGYSSVL